MKYYFKIAIPLLFGKPTRCFRFEICGNMKINLTTAGDDLVKGKRKP